MSSNQKETEIEDLPDEVLEFILSQIPPYKDLHDCMLVSKRWRRCVLNVAKTKLRNLHRAIVDFDIQWSTLVPIEMAPTVSKRYSHSAVIHENSMYVFGGCTYSMTTFNDLWRFDLSKRQWIRPLAMGNYPSPKACSSLVCYKNSLVLFGGWTYPPAYPLYQSWYLFDELHVYDIEANRWNCIATENGPPPMAGHSASVIGEWMIVFGGLHKPSSAIHSEKSNDIWKLNLETWKWYKQEVSNDSNKPHKRLGQTQIVLDEENILIIGGCGEPSSNNFDVWILNMSDNNSWKWIEIDVEGKLNKPINIWPNPACKVGDKIVVLNKIRENETCPVVYYPKKSWLINNRQDNGNDRKLARIDLANREDDRDENVNGRRGALRSHHKRDLLEYQVGCSNPPQRFDNASLIDNLHLPITLAAFNGPDRIEISRTKKNREKRLAHLLKVGERLKLTSNNRNNNNNSSRDIDNNNKKRHLGLYVLDISGALNKIKPYVQWLPPKKLLDNGPEETILYTLLEGKAELVMFGGIRKDETSLSLSLNINNQISNTLHFISANSYVI